MTGSLLNQGLMLMLFGMGTVFLFLGVLVVSTSCMSQLVVRFFPEPEIEPAVPRRRSKPGRTDTNAQLTSVIIAAIHQYRKNRDK